MIICALASEMTYNMHPHTIRKRTDSFYYKK